MLKTLSRWLAFGLDVLCRLALVACIGLAAAFGAAGNWSAVGVALLFALMLAFVVDWETPEICAWCGETCETEELAPDAEGVPVCLACWDQLAEEERCAY